MTVESLRAEVPPPSLATKCTLAAKEHHRYGGAACELKLVQPYCRASAVTDSICRDDKWLNGLFADRRLNGLFADRRWDAASQSYRAAQNLAIAGAHATAGTQGSVQNITTQN